MKPVQTQDIQMLLHELAKDAQHLDLVIAADEMIKRLEVEKQQKEQAIAYAILDQLAQANIKPLDSEKESLKEENEALRTVLKTIL